MHKIVSIFRMSREGKDVFIREEQELHLRPKLIQVPSTSCEGSQQVYYNTCNPACLCHMNTPSLHLSLSHSSVSLYLVPSLSFSFVLFSLTRSLFSHFSVVLFSSSLALLVPFSHHLLFSLMFSLSWSLLISIFFSLILSLVLLAPFFLFCVLFYLMCLCSLSHFLSLTLVLFYLLLCSLVFFLFSCFLLLLLYSRKLFMEETFTKFKVREPSMKVFSTKFWACCTHLFGFKQSMKVFSVKFSLPTDPRKFFSLESLPLYSIFSFSHLFSSPFSLLCSSLSSLTLSISHSFFFFSLLFCVEHVHICTVL